MQSGGVHYNTIVSKKNIEDWRIKIMNYPKAGFFLNFFRSSDQDETLYILVWLRPIFETN